VEASLRHGDYASNLKGSFRSLQEQVLSRVCVLGVQERRYPDMSMCCAQMSMGLATKKTKVVAKVASVFTNDSDEET